jgi:hypothetical protein
MIRQILVALCLLGFSGPMLVHAHSVWIEPSDGQLVIRFAEPSGNLEKSPGHLDSLTPPVAFILITNAPVAIESPKKSDHFLLVGTSPTNTACVDTSFTVRAKRKPNFYARWQPAGAGPTAPLLTLDIVLTGKPGEARAYFRGQPLGGIKATLHEPDGTEKDLTADADGFLRFTTKDPGQYMLTIAHHRESLAGFHVGQHYEQNSHNCALAWEQLK